MVGGRAEDDPKDVPDADRGAELASREPGRAPQGDAPLIVTADAQGGSRRRGSRRLRPGLVRTRTGEAYKPSAIRAYRQALNHRVLPTLGTKRLTRDQPHDAAGLRRPALRPRTLREQRPQHDPAPARDLPARPPPRRRRHQPHPQARPPRRPRPTRPRRSANRGRTAPRRPPTRRPRDLRHRPLRRPPRSANSKPCNGTTSTSTANLIHVRRSWDRQAGFIAPKSRSGNRRVPITPTLRRELLTHRLHQGKGGQGFVFPNKQRQQTLQPRHPQTPHQQSLGRLPTSRRSASTNAATPTPPT